MARPLTNDVLTALEGRTIGFLTLAEFDFADGLVRLWSGPRGRDLIYGGETWSGIGDLGEFDKFTEDDELSVTRTIATLRVTSDMIDSVEGEANEGRQVRLFFVIVDMDTGDAIGHIEDAREMGQSWVEAEMDQEPGARMIRAAIKMELIGEGAVLRRRHVRRLTYEDGLEIDGSDHFLEFSADPNMKSMGPANVPTIPGYPGFGTPWGWGRWF